MFYLTSLLLYNRNRNAHNAQCHRCLVCALSRPITQLAQAHVCCLYYCMSNERSLVTRKTVIVLINNNHSSYTHNILHINFQYYLWPYSTKTVCLCTCARIRCSDYKLLLDILWCVKNYIASTTTTTARARERRERDEDRNEKKN